MEMTNDEIVVRYRQAKEKGKQLNILADLNACSADDIVNVLVEHGGYKLDRLSRSRGKAKLLKKEESDKIVDNLMRKHVEKAIEKAADKQLEKAKNITPVTTFEQIKNAKSEFLLNYILQKIDVGLIITDLEKEIEKRRDRINALEAEITEFKNNLAELRAWEEKHI